MASREIRGRLNWKGNKALANASLRIEVSSRKGKVRRTIPVRNGRVRYTLTTKNRLNRKDRVSLTLTAKGKSLGIVNPPANVEALENFSAVVFPRSVPVRLRYANGKPVANCEIRILQGRALNGRVVRKLRSGRDGRFQLPYGPENPVGRSFRIDAAFVDASGATHRLTIGAGHTLTGVPPMSLDLRVAKQEMYIPVRMRWLDGSVAGRSTVSLHGANGRRLGRAEVRDGAGTVKIPGGRPAGNQTFELRARVGNRNVRVLEPKLRGSALQRVVIASLIDLDDEPLVDLRTDVPIAFFPVRLETKFRLTGNDPELLVKIVPDPVQVTAHDPALSAHEKALKQRFEVSLTGEDEADAAAFGWLAAQVGIPRAIHIASVRRAGAAKPNRVPRVKLLPKRWHVYVRGRRFPLVTHSSAPVPDNVRDGLPMAPLPGEVEAEDLEGLMDSQGALWLRDFNAAVKVGMAVRIKLDRKLASELRGGSEALDVTVVGVSDLSPAQTSRQLGDLFAAHRVDQGLELLDASTPTNITEASGTVRQPAAADWWNALGRAPEVVEASREPGSLARAFGLPASAATFELTPADSLAHDRIGESVLRSVWPGTIGHALEPIMKHAGSPGAEKKFFDDWASRYLRADGGLPMFRVGDQPYGVVLVSKGPGNPARPSAKLRSILSDLRRSYWEKPKPVRVSEARSGAKGLQDLMDVLAIEPGPAVYQLVEAEDWRGRHTIALFLLQWLYSEKNRQEYGEMWERLKNADTVGEQLGVLMRTGPQHVKAAMQAHRDRVGILDEVGSGVPTAYRPPVRTDPISFHYFFDKGGQQEVVDAASDAGIIDWLDRVADGAAIKNLKTPNGVTARVLKASLSRGDTEALRPVFGKLAAFARQAPEPEKWLDAVVGRHVGLAGHRLDAWIAALASEELDLLRRKNPTGLLVGSMGWVENLEPKSEEQPNGYVFAPSQATATTAAILRNAWESFGSGSAYSLAAVNLSSDRVRRALWILDGVREGRSIASVMGARLEASLHRAGASEAVPAIRTAVSKPGADALLQTVDGEICARAFESPPVDNEARTNRRKIAKAIETLSAATRKKTLETLVSLADDLDAIADLLLAEGVHLIAQGREDRLSGWLSSQRSGESRPPEISITEPSPPTRIEMHWAIVLCPSKALAGAGWVMDALAKRHAGLEALARLIVGDARRHAVGISESSITLAQLKLSALSAIRLAERSSDENGNGLLATISEQAGRTIEGWTGDADTSPFHEFNVLARMFMRMIARGAPLSDPWPTLPGTFQGGETRTVLGMLERDECLVPVSHGIDRNHFALSPDPGAQEAGFDWLAGVGKVNEDVGRLVRLVNASEAIRGDAVWRLEQVRHGENDDNVDTVIWNGDAIGTRKVCGFVLAEWAERLPNPTVTAGAAIKFDGPQARAPQAMILALPHGNWHRNALLEVADEVRALARLRTIGPEHLEGVGQMLPATLLPGKLS
tara:strand:+ start:2752 stop:7167 length:4416 start_codon:yes stop_codon:yes gene_type:complete